MIPQPGEIWHSHRTGYKVRINHIDANSRRVYITDGQSLYPMYLSDFEDPGNAWRKIQ